MYKVSPFGYFARPEKISQGPWFKEFFVEEDGLEYYYHFHDGASKQVLLSNNVPVHDRDNLDRIYRGYKRAKTLATVGGLWLGVETVLRVPYFKTMATGWRILSAIGLGIAFKLDFNYINS